MCNLVANNRRTIGAKIATYKKGFADLTCDATTVACHAYSAPGYRRCTDVLKYLRRALGEGT